MNIQVIPKWQSKTHNHIQFSENRVCFNAKTGRKKKYTSNGGSKGVWLDAKTFLPRSKFKHNLELIKEIGLPF